MGIFNYFQKKDKNIAQEEPVTKVSEIHQDNFEYKAQNKELDEIDYLIADAGRIIIEKDMASIGVIQRVCKIGFNRAARIMDFLCEMGVVGEEEGTKPRKILVSRNEYEKIVENYHPKTEVLRHTETDYQTERISLYNKKFDYMEGHDFEYYCADLLRKNGFSNVEVTQGRGDHGIDILAEKEDITYAIQCKCYSSDIGNAAVQQAYTGKMIYKRDIAVIITNRHFTAQAIEEASTLSVKLWDRERLLKMVKSAQEK